jgi:integrase
MPLKLTPRQVTTRNGTATVWYITGKCPITGERFRTSTRCHRKVDAEAALAKTQEQQRLKAKHGIQGVKTFAEAAEEYLAKGGEARYLPPLIIELGEMRLTEIDDTHLSAGAKKHYPNAKPSTLVRQWYSPFQWVWNAACRANMAVPREWSKPKVPKRKLPEIPSDDWLDKVLTACTNANQRAAIIYMSFSGARAAEVVAIPVRCYDREAGTITLEDTKNGVARVTYLPPVVQSYMDHLTLGGPDEPLFGYASRHSLNRILGRTAKRAGLKHFGPHKAGRHLFAKRFLGGGRTLRELMDGGGWLSVQAVMLYAHLERSRVEEAVRSVATPLKALPAPCTLDHTVVDCEFSEVAATIENKSKISND